MKLHRRPLQHAADRYVGMQLSRRQAAAALTSTSGQSSSGMAANQGLPALQAVTEQDL
jgi:hypothetical protein